MNDPKATAAYHPGDAPVTRPDLDAIQARVDAATPGPWYVDEIPETGECRVLFDADPEGQPTHMPVTSGGSHRGDADLIAHARQDVPALLAALAAERARADQAERNVNRYQDRARENRKLLDQYAGQLAKIPHTEDCLIGEWNEAAGHSMPCTCWKSAAPTAEQ